MSDKNNLNDSSNSDNVENEDNFGKVIDDTLLNLKIISQISDYDKITAGNGNIIEIDKNSQIQGMRRWYNGDNRYKSVDHVGNVIESSYNIVDSIVSGKSTTNYYFKKDDSDLLQSLFYELSNSIKGLNHLKITYKTDIPLLSRIDMHIEKINNLNEKINRHLKVKS